MLRRVFQTGCRAASAAPPARARRAFSTPGAAIGSSDGFYGSGTGAEKSGGPDEVIGEVLDLGADLRNVRPGERLSVPYELTVRARARRLARRRSNRRRQLRERALLLARASLATNKRTTRETAC